MITITQSLAKEYFKMSAFRNYYKILAVGPYASREEIRTSFRKLAKKYHPDTTQLDGETATARIRIILEAYRILMDESKRTAYNLRFKSRLGKQHLSYRETLKKRPDDPYSQALLIFYDLLNENGSEAVSSYERMRRRQGDSFNLLSLLGFADYLDCIFLLAEEYQKRGEFEDAVRYYEEAFQADQKWDYFRHFRTEIKLRIRDIYCRHLAKRAEPRSAIKYYRKLLDEYDFPKKERAFFYKKMAESYCDLNKIDKAKVLLAEALLIKKNLSGTKKIRQKLGLF
jgi:tetratricopeptide (TPR) repeat protein